MGAVDQRGCRVSLIFGRLGAKADVGSDQGDSRGAVPRPDVRLGRPADILAKTVRNTRNVMAPRGGIYGALQSRDRRYLEGAFGRAASSLMGARL